MKTNLIEIFQTIRADLQPYASRGYTVHENSETGYDLYSEKNIETAGEKVTERFFVGIYINGENVELKLNTTNLNNSDLNLSDFGDNKAGIKISELTNEQHKDVNTLVEIAHVNFKENEWI